MRFQRPVFMLLFRLFRSIEVLWVTKEGEEIKTLGYEGQTLLQLAHRYGIPMEGACEGVCACSTCHVILEQDAYDVLEARNEISEDEDDMLDLAWGLTPTYDLFSLFIPRAY